MPGDTWVPGGNDGDPGAAYRDPHITVEVDGTTDNSSCGQEPILAFGHVWVEGQCWVLMAGRALSELSLLSPLPSPSPFPLPLPLSSLSLPLSSLSLSSPSFFLMVNDHVGKDPRVSGPHSPFERTPLKSVL